ncbi:hypothetical protein EYS14_17090 [Alteromonadaceae bacterium M269]|nr:hypothetical protein EYS14_17090 [Alteromonadaceae bacterium M269]
MSKKNIKGVLVTLILFHCFQIHASDLNRELQQELGEMRVKDQAVREELTKIGFNANPDALKAYVEKQNKVDDENTERALDIFEEFGWPTPELVGKQGVKDFLLIIQHADFETQKLMLPKVKSAYENGLVSGQNMALLTDRVLVKSGLAQRYGTQVSIKDKIIKVDPVEDENNLDQIRASIGLEPMEQYLKRLRSLYNIE